MIIIEFKLPEFNNYFINFFINKDKREKTERKKRKKSKNNSDIRVNELTKDRNIIAGVVSYVFSQDENWNDFRVKKLTIKYEIKKKDINLNVIFTEIECNKNFSVFRFCKCGKKKPVNASLKINDNKIMMKNKEIFHHYYILKFDIPESCIEDNKISEMRFSMQIKKGKNENEHVDLYVLPRNYAKVVDSLELSCDPTRALYCFKYNKKNNALDPKVLIEDSDKLIVDKKNFSVNNVYSFEESTKK